MRTARTDLPHLQHARQTFANDCFAKTSKKTHTVTFFYLQLYSIVKRKQEVPPQQRLLRAADFILHTWFTLKRFKCNLNSLKCSKLCTSHPAWRCTPCRYQLHVRIYACTTSVSSTLAPCWHPIFMHHINSLHSCSFASAINHCKPNSSAKISKKRSKTFHLAVMGICTLRDD